MDFTQQYGQYISKAASLASEAGNISKRLTQDLMERSKQLDMSNLGLQPTSNLYDNSEEKISEIRATLDSKFDKEKIDGLKRLIAMISKGKNVAEFFPDVVKNVASQSFEVRKLVYIYMLRYAEQEPDLALLSINTFQKGFCYPHPAWLIFEDLTDKNPLIRAMALRVMSSIKVPVIAPLIMLAIKKGTTDLSPYVRKAAANAIPKCFSLDANQREGLMEILESLLNDNSTIVLGTVISSFNQICPNRFDLIHKHYRKLCRLLIDADPWSQVQIVGLLMRYARCNFLNPHQVPIRPENETPQNAADFYKEKPDLDIVETKELDPDHLLLLECCKPLLQSQNIAVVFETAKLFFYVAPDSQCFLPVKAIIRTLASAKELQYFLLLNILTLCAVRQRLFQPYFRTFFLYDLEPTYVQDVKLELLSVICSEENVSVIIRELKEYVRNPNKRLVAKTIEVIGRISSRLPQIAEESLSILMALISSDDESVVGEAVVVIRQLLQMRPESNKRLIVALSKALNNITVPMARASILWLIGQYCELVPHIAPDSLRVAVKNFAAETVVVKLQILSLGAKLLATMPGTEVVQNLFLYALNMARFDLDYDVRDRGRFLKALVYDKLTQPNVDESTSSYVKDILLATKPVSESKSSLIGRDRFTLGTLSHAVNFAVNGYSNLPEWPTTVPDSSVRHVPETSTAAWNRDNAVVSSAVKEISRLGTKPKPKVPLDLDNFLNETDEEDSDDEEEEEEDEEEETDEDDEEEEEEDDDEEEEEDDDEEEEEEEEEDEEEEGEDGTAKNNTK